MNQSSGTLSHDVIGGNGVYRPHLNDALSAHVEDGRVVGNGQLGLSIFERTSPTVE
jgi:hypothetical protein